MCSRRAFGTGFRHWVNGNPCGFTLAELLIALAILGVIATFTIPKVLQSQSDNKFKAVGKEVASMLSGAYQAYQQNNAVTASFTGGDLTPFMNYVAIQTTGSVDQQQGGTTDNCTVGNYCVKLHNGAAIWMWAGMFGDTNPLNAVYFEVDPDGKVTDGTTNGPGKSVVFILYKNGQINTWGDALPGNDTSSGSIPACPACDPPWFSWN